VKPLPLTRITPYFFTLRVVTVGALV
jgi:hypothetical protein